jgi:hypothetical protein
LARAKTAVENSNTPDEADVQEAVAYIEQCFVDLDSERGKYMATCKSIRARMAGDYDNAANKGISKKALKVIIQERQLERKIDGLHQVLEPDVADEVAMLSEVLGDFGNTGLGVAAISAANKAKGNAALAEVGA